MNQPSSPANQPLLITASWGHARRRPRRRTGSSPRASPSLRRIPSSRRRRRCSWSASPGQCRSCSSGPGPPHCRARRAACSAHWASSAQTCRRCGCRGTCAPWSTRWRPSRGPSIASRRAPIGAGSNGWHCRHTWGCRWAPGAGRPAWRRSCWGTADSRTGSIARSAISGSSWKLCTGNPEREGRQGVSFMRFTSTATTRTK